MRLGVVSIPYESVGSSEDILECLTWYFLYLYLQEWHFSFSCPYVDSRLFMKSSIKEKAPGSIVPSLSRYSEFSCRLLTARGSYSSVWQPRLCSHAQNVCYSSAWQLLLITDKRTHHVVYWFIRIILCPYLLLHHQILSILIFNFNFQSFSLLFFIPHFHCHLFF